LSPNIVAVVKGRVELYQHMFPMSEICNKDNLAIIGLPSASGVESIVPIVNAQSKLFAAMIAKKCQLPPRAQREAWLEKKRKGWVAGMYRPLQVDVPSYVEGLNSILGDAGGSEVSKTIQVKDVSFQNTANASETVSSEEEEYEEEEEEEE
jgi:hypothetical protein